MVRRESEAESIETRRLPYLPGLDGLRALAVTAVLLYHADQRWLPGGFLGVEVFFVISGFLITSLLLAEWRERGRIEIGAFYLRRARRLLPALFLLLLGVLAFTAAFAPEEVTELRRDALAAAGYFSNWQLIFGGQSYFESVGRPPLLRHLWSLAVEEQFYLVAPLFLAFGLRLLGRRVTAAVLLAGAAGSAALMAALYDASAGPSRVYYGTDTRATGLLLGAALALVWAPASLEGRRAAWVLDALGAVSLGALAILLFRLDQYDPLLYRGGFVLAGLSTAGLIVAASSPGARAGRLLGWAPLRWAGLRSYAIYLWHWPVFMLTRPELDIALDGPALLAVRLAVTAALAEASYRLVETPVRRGALELAWQALCRGWSGRRWWLRLQWIGAASALLACAAALGVWVMGAQAPSAPPYLAVERVRIEPRSSAPSLATADDDATLPVGPAALLAGPPALVPPAGPVVPAPPTATPGSPVATPTLAPPTPTLPSPPAPVWLPAGYAVAIGDSVMLGAAPELARVMGGLAIDAEVGRQTSAAIDLLRARQAAGQLGELVIVHLGNNGTISAGQFDEMLRVLDGVSLVVVVNVKVPREWEGTNNAVLADGVKRHPNTVLADWHALSSKRPDLFWDDGIHVRPEGAGAYAGVIAAAMN